jgi:hypothetical protein
MGIKNLFGGSKSPKPSPDDVFAQYDLVCLLSSAHTCAAAAAACAVLVSCCKLPRVVADTSNQPPVGYIAKLEQATARLENATTSEEAIAIVRAYIQPKVEEKGMQPLVALDSLDSEVSCFGSNSFGAWTCSWTCPLITGH